MIGQYRMVVTTDAIKFFAVGTDKPVTFLIKAIRKCRIPKSDPHYFKVCIYLVPLHSSEIRGLCSMK